MLGWKCTKWSASTRLFAVRLESVNAVWILESMAEGSALSAAPDLIVVVDVGLSFLCPKTQLNCGIIPLANRQMARVPSPRTFRTTKKRYLLLRPDQIWSSESDSHILNQPTGKKCKLFVLFQVQGDFFCFSPFFSVPFVIFALLFSLPPRSNSDPGSHSRPFSPPTHYGSCVGFFFARRFQLFFPRWLASTCDPR